MCTCSHVCIRVSGGDGGFDKEWVLDQFGLLTCRLKSVPIKSRVLAQNFVLKIEIILLG